ncbi:hypothetical protein [Bradyrhizobium sp. CB3481]|nr:hypothetical protein [Bradyrhizobium sp. CB3481]WFU19908.1 hypothetical protein QA643_17035 [Bradyrhizobium sp. CB3481]
MQFASSDIDLLIELEWFRSSLNGSPDFDDFNHPGVAETRHPGSTNF